MKFHSFKTFKETGWKQWTTWIGILPIIFFIYEFWPEIRILVKNVLSSPELVTALVGFLTGSIMILVDKFKDNDNGKSDI